MTRLKPPPIVIAPSSFLAVGVVDLRWLSWTYVSFLLAYVAIIGLWWSSLAFVGLRWLSLAFVGCHWLSLAWVGLGWLSLAIVGLRGRRGPVLAGLGHILIEKESIKKI